MSRFVVVFAVVSVLIASVFVAPVAATSDVDEADEPMVHVSVSESGDATVSLVVVYDLTSDDEHTAFGSLEDDEAAKADIRDRFADRMQSVADELDGQYTITDESIEVRSEDDHGVVTVSVTWTEFAAVDDGTLVVTEPFASDFETDRQVVVVGPEESTIESVDPEPTVEDGEMASWEVGTDLTDFELEVSLATADEAAGNGETRADETDGMPGFGLLAALLAIVAGFGVAVRPTR